MLRGMLPSDVYRTHSLWRSISSFKPITNKTMICNFTPSLKTDANGFQKLQTRTFKLNLNDQMALFLARSVKQHSYKCLRNLSDSADASPSQAEMTLINILKEKFPLATDIAVVDISGGCGSMYEIYVESPEFKGMRLVKQHKMVNEALKGEIKEMHGLRISTLASK